VDCNVRDSAITHSHFAALRVKDAICDQFVAKVGRRPSVDVQDPMLPLNLHLYRNRLVLSLDSSGESLHKRGYRTILTKAPLNEALAAGVIQLSQWKCDAPLADPMCGSGTFPIEASWIALRRPPGLTRKRFGFHGWLDFDIRLWTQLRDAARDQIRKALPAPIVGSDLRQDAIAFADRNARAAGVRNVLHFEVKKLADFRPPGTAPGVILINPPYGERIGEAEELSPLYQSMGKVLKERCSGWTAWILSGNPELEERIGLEPSARLPLYNGRIACRLLKYDLY
jgi:putative N6-adenine-specific DNA methylase